MDNLMAKIVSFHEPIGLIYGAMSNGVNEGLCLLKNCAHLTLLIFRN